MTAREGTVWPSAEAIGRLGQAHRRAVAAALATVQRRLADLEAAGQATLPRAAMEELARTLRAAGGSGPAVEVPSMIAALRVTVDELEPERMTRYGPLDPAGRATLMQLVEALGRLLDGVRASEAHGGAGPVLRPVGVVRSPFRVQDGTPIQPGRGRRMEGRVEVEPEYREALADLEGFERIWLLCWLHRARPWRARVVPYRDDTPRGLFATRAPARPNPVGISAVRLLRVEGCVLHVAELDILDGTPVLDVKPYVPEFDAFPGARAGWLENAAARDLADGRFARKDQED